MTLADDQPAPRRAARWGLRILAVLLIVLFSGLGTWQVQRLQWKLALIERVESRVHSAPGAPPPPVRWGHLTAEADEYRPVRLKGSFLYSLTTPVQAVSDLGAGWWLLTPLCTAGGYVVLVNRGFVPMEQGGPARYPGHRAEAPGTACTPSMGPRLRGDDGGRSGDDGGRSGDDGVVGLVRMTEPKGGFLRENDPAGNRWYSRDVQAIAKARGLYNVAPYFVDAAKDQDPAGAPDHPVGGLTVITFHNSHLVYAFTWYLLAIMVAGAWWWVARGGGNREQEDVSRK
jgi:surfeit locus 1 family protein